jgi:hypothetical protein
MNPSVEYYCAHSPSTDPGEYAGMLTGLPTDLPGLHQIVQNFVIHNWKIRAHHPHLQHPDHMTLHQVRDVLEVAKALDARPLTEERPVEKKMILDCRHYAGILCALLRQQGIPARVRCGFGVYLEEAFAQDHYVCEFWNGERWVLEDADVMLHDIPRDQFVVAGQAWRDSRAGKDDPQRYACGEEWRGYGPMKMNILKDLAGLNKDEEMSLASWGLIEREDGQLTPEDMTLLDELAEVTAKAHELSEDEFTAMRKQYAENDLLRVPPVVKQLNYISWIWSERPSVLNNG